MTRAFRTIVRADLQDRNTFGVPARAPCLVEIADPLVLPSVFADGVATPRSMVLGSGSNILFADDPDASVLALAACRQRIRDDDGERVLVRAEAGAPWHGFVMWTLERGVFGLQNLALIPGTVGAAPIQNIGAYGVEVSDCVHAVQVYDRDDATLKTFHRDACAFAYRDSLFKRAGDRYIVTAVEFELSRAPTVKLDYAGLRDELAAMQVAAPTPAQVADAVIRIRRRKLPDPVELGNAGSFFKNPIVPSAQADALVASHTGMPTFATNAAGTRKLSAAWLIDQCGWKGYRDGDAGVADAHALVLVNHGTATGAELLALARSIADSVRARFDVTLEPEPRIVGAAW